MTKTIANGDTISVHYRGTASGEEFDSSHGRDPINFTVGTGQMITGFDTAVVGMTEGETKTVTFGPEEGYGVSYPDRVTEMPTDAFPPDFELNEGTKVPLMGPGGQHLLGTVQTVTDESVTVDLNHPLAGKELTFEIQVVSVGSDT